MLDLVVCKNVKLLLQLSCVALQEGKLRLAHKCVSIDIPKKTATLIS